MKVATFDRLIKLKSTLFVLPLTLAGALLPFAITTPTWDLWRWIAIIVGFTAARTAGMAFNEWIDKEIDAKNARTLARVLPRGEMAIWQVALIAWGGIALFLLIAASFGKALFIGALVLSTLIALYSYTKRFTSLCHFLLGAILGAGPVMAFLAMTGTFSPLALLLGGATFCSLSASDIIYAIQDTQFDRIEGLHSIPALLGDSQAKRLSRLLHLLSIALLLFLGYQAHLGPLYYLGLALLTTLLFRFHLLVMREDHSRYTRLFFRCNVAFSNLVFLSILGGLLWPISF
ncbi:MAG: 4-hydroxybenzoate octaprenyltransferase [Parachlamydiales bacterium]